MTRAQQLAVEIEVRRTMQDMDDCPALALLGKLDSEPPSAPDACDLPDECLCGALLGPGDIWVHCSRCAS